MAIKKLTDNDFLAKSFGFKYDKVSDKGNLVCKKLSKKSLKALKDHGYKVYQLPSKIFVVVPTK